MFVKLQGNDWYTLLFPFLEFLNVMYLDGVIMLKWEDH